MLELLFEFLWSKTLSAPSVSRYWKQPIGRPIINLFTLVFRGKYELKQRSRGSGYFTELENAALFSSATSCRAEKGAGIFESSKKVHFENFPRWMQQMTIAVRFLASFPFFIMRFLKLSCQQVKWSSFD